jgi:hypothetical protein
VPSAIKSPEKTFEIQSEYLRAASEGLMAQATKFGDLRHFRCRWSHGEFHFHARRTAIQVHDGPDAFVPIPNAWGRQGWTTATLSKLSAEELKNALETAWAHAQKKRRRR